MMGPGVQVEMMKEEVGEEKKEVEVENDRLRGAGGGRGGEKVQEEENEKKGMDEEVKKEEAEQVEEEKKSERQRLWAERCRGKKWREESLLSKGCRRRRRKMRRR